MAEDRGVLSTHIYSDGRHHDALYVDGGPGSTRPTGSDMLRMDGREVFRHAVVRMAEAIDTALEANGLTPGDIDWLVPHQANKRIIEAMAKKLNLPPDRVVIDRRPPRQHLGRLDPAGLDRGGRRWPDSSRAIWS